MATDGHIHSYSAADIEKYQQGRLSAAEMHAMEKAALEDPFLADAMEGYADAGPTLQADLAELRARLAQPDDKARVVPMIPTSRTSYSWLKVAAMAVIVFGAAFLVYRMGFTGQQPGIAMEREVADTQNQVDRTFLQTDTAPAASNGNTATGAGEGNPNVDGFSAASPTATAPAGKNLTIAAPDKQDATPAPSAAGKTPSPVTSNQSRLPRAAGDDLKNNNEITATPGQKLNTGEKASTDDRAEYFAGKALPDKVPGIRTSSPVTGTETAKSVQQPAAASEERKDVQVQGYARAKKSSMDTARVQAAQSNRNIAAAKQQGAAMGFVNQSNTFRGRVYDENNNALPFANITNARDNVGTYTDARGNFTLISPDTVLDVRVRSLGFTSQQVELKPGNTATDNRIVMEESNEVSAVVISRQTLNSSRPRNTGMVLEEAEPVDGWRNYDTYIANNLQVPDNEKSRPGRTGEVELSFEVDKKGEPVNITVTKSLCESCDQEAIRLLKAGPKWKRNARKGRTTVTIPF